ncbi:type II toxin-antitoxin system RelE/ParE family toxin [Rhizobium phaseoli]|uniref:type II toxin-antitoxin system RelE/ParE family toxin n=1 Tax=Rhizobium phaseoli TaxID=396 RepID=UPI00296F17E5
MRITGTYAPLLSPAARPGRIRIRRRPYGDYLIFYRIADAIEVLHVLRGAVDYERLLFPDE